MDSIVWSPGELSGKTKNSLGYTFVSRGGFGAIFCMQAGKD